MSLRSGVVPWELFMLHASTCALAAALVVITGDVATHELLSHDQPSYGSSCCISFICDSMKHITCGRHVPTGSSLYDILHGKAASVTDRDWSSNFHTPVLCREAVELLVKDVKGTYLDITLGGGGHAEAILNTLHPKGRLIGIDRDAAAIKFANKRLSHFNNFKSIQANFAYLQRVLEHHKLPANHYDGLIADLGVSSHQLDTASRGFSWSLNGTLDMRMSYDVDEEGNTQETDLITNYALTAQHAINRFPEKQIQTIIREYGEDKRASKIAKAITTYRQSIGYINTTNQLRSIIESCCSLQPKDQRKTCARVFQAFRIWLNDELHALDELLHQCNHLLKVGGRLVIISYHKLEDVRVKREIRKIDDLETRHWKTLTKRPIVASEGELLKNKRAKSGKLRAAEKL